MRILLLAVFGLGNTLHKTPLMRALRSRYPEARIDLVVDQAGYPAIEEMDGLYLDDIWSFTDPKGVPQMPGYDVYVICRPANGWLKHVIPPGGRTVGSFSDMSCWTQHEIEWNMELAYALGYRGPIPDPVFPLPEAYLLPLKALGSHGFVGIHVGCLPTWPWKRWPLTAWAELVRMLDSANYQIVLVGGRAERADADTLLGVLDGHRVVDLVGRTTLKETADVIRQCRLFISTDSGPMHLASALSVPTLGIFGPTSVIKNRPWKGRVVRTAESLLCMPCQEKPDGMAMMRSCPHRACLVGLPVERVYEAAVQMLEEAHALARSPGPLR